MSDCPCTHPNDSSGFTAGLFLGLVTGAASAHFLMNTDKGKELLETLKTNAGEAIKDLGENPALAEKIADLQATMDRARAAIKPISPKKNFFQRMGASLGK